MLKALQMCFCFPWCLPGKSLWCVGGLIHLPCHHLTLYSSAGNLEKIHIGAGKLFLTEKKFIKDETKIKEEEKVSPTNWWITMVNGSCRTWSMTAHSSSVCCLSWAGEHIWERRTHHSVNNRKQSFCFHIEIWEIKQQYLWMGVQGSAFNHTSSLCWLF